jgi:hypothetical protein
VPWKRSTVRNRFPAMQFAYVITLLLLPEISASYCPFYWQVTLKDLRVPKTG